MCAPRHPAAHHHRIAAAAALHPGAHGQAVFLLARFLKDGTFVEHERVHHLTTRRVRVTTDTALPVNLDGELGLSTPADFTVERNALHVMVPTTSLAARLDGAA